MPASWQKDLVRRQNIKVQDENTFLIKIYVNIHRRSTSYHSKCQLFHQAESGRYQFGFIYCMMIITLNQKYREWIALQAPHKNVYNLIEEIIFQQQLLKQLIVNYTE